MSWSIHRLSVTEEHAGNRIDQFLAEQIAELSRIRARKIIDIGGVHLNGRRIRTCSKAVRVQDKVEVYLDHQPLTPFRLTPEQILYQDRFLIVLNKPAGVDTQPTHARYKGTLYEALHWYLQQSAAHGSGRKAPVGMLQRLDRGTSGLLLFSIHPRAHKPLSQMFLNQQVDKDYLALVRGLPPHDEGEIVSQLARCRRDNRVRSVDRGGKHAVTRYRVIERFHGYALLKVRLLTGRSHQIRAHLAEQGWPLVGDLRYDGPAGISGRTVGRPLLHAERLALTHPLNQELLDLRVPLPEDMCSSLDACRSLYPSHRKTPSLKGRDIRC